MHDWLPHGPSYQLWPAYIHPHTSTLYCRLTNNTNMFSTFCLQWRYHFTLTSSTSDSLPQGSVPISVDRWLPYPVTQDIPCVYPILHHQTSLPLILLLISLCSPIIRNTSLAHVSIPANLPALITDIHSNNFTLASDVSSDILLAPLHGLSMVIPVTPSLATGYNVTAAKTTDLSTFRSEASGYSGSVYALQALLSAYPLKPSAPPFLAVSYIDNTGDITHTTKVHATRLGPFSGSTDNLSNHSSQPVNGSC